MNNLSKLAGMLPKWEHAKTMADINFAAPSLHAMTHATPPHDTLYDDIRDARLAIDLFLNSEIQEGLDLVMAKRDSSMYHALSYACLLGGTALLTYERKDIEKAIAAMKATSQLANQNRRPTWKHNLHAHTFEGIKSMSPLQRHAELVYAETILMKAGLQILYDQSIVLAVKEALKAYAAHGIYKALESYMLQERDEGTKLDAHLVSGIAFGMAGFNLALSAVPDFILRLVEYVGFRGDRTLGFWYCRSMGGWDDDDAAAAETDVGLRRPFCDMVLMGYNIVLSQWTPLSHLDVPLGDRILAYYLALYPNGVAFLALKGRKLAGERQLDEAKAYYQRAMDAQDVWPQLKDISRWELGTLALIEKDWKTAFTLFRSLFRQSHWSKAAYTYLMAVSLYMLAADQRVPEKRKVLMDQVAQAMSTVTQSQQKIAGKSIFIEKFFARKSRKFELQGRRLLFPDLEILLAIGALELIPVTQLRQNLARIAEILPRLEKSHSFYVYDDVCLSHLLRATFHRFLLDPDSHTIHAASLQAVFVHAPNIQLDHWIYYFAKYEAAQMMILDEKYTEAQEVLEAILRCTEKNSFGVGAGVRAKNKYSMENALVMKCHSCLGYLAEVLNRRS